MSGLEETLVKAYAKRKGISEEEARAYIEAVKATGGDEALKRLAAFFEVLGASAGDIAKLDADMKSWVAPVMGVYAMKTLAAGEGRPDIEELAERLTVIKSVLGGDELTKLYEAHLNELKTQVATLAEKLEAKEREALMQAFQEQLNKVTEMYSQQIEALNNQLNNLSKLVEEYRKNPPTTAEEKESFVSRVVNLQKEIEEVRKDTQKWYKVLLELREKTGEPVLQVIGFDVLKYLYHDKDALFEVISRGARDVAENSELALAIGKPGTSEINVHLSDTAKIHFKIENMHGSVLFYGVKPVTEIYNVEIDVSEGYPNIKLIPII